MSGFDDSGLPQLDTSQAQRADGDGVRSIDDLERLYDVPVTISAVLGHTRLPIAELLRLGPGMLLELDRKVGEAIDIRVNDRLVARGEVVLVDDRLGVTMTEIVLPAS